jgi:anti-sigma factor RsiW
MTDCPHDPLMVQALVDGELDAGHAAQVEAQIAACPACAAARDRLLALRAALRAEGVRESAPDALRRRLAARFGPAAEPALVPPAPLPPRPRPARPSRRWAWMGGGAGVAIAASAVLAFGVGQTLQQVALTDEIIAGHVRSLQVAHLTDVATSDQHVVKPWFDGKLDFSPAVVELKPQGFPLVGGRLDYLHGRAVAAIVYQRGRHTINLFVWPATDGDAGAASQTRKGFNLRHWRAGGMTYWAVSDVNPADLALFEADLRARIPR